MHLLAMTPKARPAKAVMVAVAVVGVVVAVAVNPRVATPKAPLAKTARLLSRRLPKVALPPTKSPLPVANVSANPVASVSPVVRRKRLPCRRWRPAA